MTDLVKILKRSVSSLHILSEILSMYGITCTGIRWVHYKYIKNKQITCYIVNEICSYTGTVLVRCHLMLVQ